MSTRKKDEHRTGLEIAVIGMNGRFPGAKNLEEFWNNLKNGVEPIDPFNNEGLRGLRIEDELINHPVDIKVRAFLEDIEYFDADFFDYPLLEAKVMDPQMRIFHECVWNALEDAGYTPERYKGAIGLYAGASPNIYWEILTLFSKINTPSVYFTPTLSMDKDFTRIACKMNLRGPSFTVSSECSTSLLAIHLACQGLLSGDCSMAVAGGVSITLPKKQGYLYQEYQILSSDKDCRAFDMKAKQCVFGNGVGAVVLKTLEDAVADGDHIYAVIKGSAINNDPNKRITYNDPNIKGRAMVIKDALRAAEVDPESIGYIEILGAATQAGDPFEIETLKLAFDTEKKKGCLIGSLKPNVGHLYDASGVASFIKTVLSLKHKQIPPSINLSPSNQKINLESNPFHVNTTLSNWNHDEYPLRAGISSFAIGGTNVHVLLEEAPKRATSSESKNWKLLILSAKTETALETLSENLCAYLQKNSDVDLADIAYTLQVGREPFTYRKKVLCSTIDEAISELSMKKKDMLPGRSNGYMCPLRSDNVQPPVVFMFAGQSSQYVNMGVELYQQEKIFREELDRCFAILQPIVGYNMREFLYPPSSQENRAKEKIKQTAVAQPLIFAVEYALARLLIKWGIKPEAMIGYSFGEYVAACLAGIFSLEDALMLIAMRGKMMNGVSAGAMLSVPLSEEEVTPFLNHELSLAIVNGASCIVAGPEKAISAFEQQMKQNHYICMRVSLSFAAHSTELEAVSEEFEEYAKKLTLHEPVIPYISSITGTWITGKQATDPKYWARHMCDTIRFSKGINKIMAEIPHAIFVEIGPGRDLSVLIRRFIQENPQQRILNTIKNPQRKVSDIYFLLNQIGSLWGAGVKIDWYGMYANETRRRISLPTYPFERQYCRIEDSTQDYVKILSAH